MVKDLNKKLQSNIIAYAFLAQATRNENDLFSGLIPIFKPIAKIHANKEFDVKEFASMVNQLYGLKIPHWAIQDLTPRLEKAGVIRIAEDTQKHVYCEISEEFGAVTENDIKGVLKCFVEFASKILGQNNLSINKSELENGFLSKLVEMDFISVLLKPDKPGAIKWDKTLTLRGLKKEDSEQKISSDQYQIDILCASFIVDIYHNDQDTYDLVMQIATGAMLCETVLNLQSPDVKMNLSGLDVILDTPLLMSVLGLTTEEAYKYASELCEQLREKGARLAVYDHSVDELKNNLTGAISAFSAGEGYGVTARRLSIQTFHKYANVVLQHTDIVLRKNKVSIIESPNTKMYISYFEDSDKEDFENRLGHYGNLAARERDAKSVTATIRRRRGKRVKMEKFQTVGHIFVTENTKVVNTAIEFLKERRLFRDGEVPPALSEKYLAGLLWVLYGGKGVKLAKHLLIANCAAALEPRSDVVSKMHKFISEMGQEQAEIFGALMTEARAGQYAMQHTLGDPTLITKDNVAEILEKVRASSTEKIEAQKRREVDSLAEKYEEMLEEMRKENKKVRDDVLDAEGRAAELESKMRKANQQAEDSDRARIEMENARIADKKRLIEKCMEIAIEDENRFNFRLGLIAGIGMVGISWFNLSSSDNFFLKSFSAIGAFFGSMFIFWKLPSYLLAEWVHKRRRKKFEDEVKKSDVSDDLYLFEIDWKNRQVLQKGSQNSEK